MNRYVASLFGLILLVVVACTPSAHPTQPLVTATVEPPTPAVAATEVLPTPDWSGLLGNGVDLDDPSQADQSVREVVDWAREASGLRAELGPHADEIFQLVDQAQSALVEDLMDQWPAGAKPKGMPAPLPPRRWTPPRASALTSLVMVSSYLVVSPMMLRASQTGDSSPQVTEYDQPFGENITAHVKQKLQVTGSKLEMELEMKLRAEKDGTVYEEQAKGKIAITICPDEKGNVPLDLTLQSGAGSGDKGFEIKMAIHAVGHVDDEGNLAGYDEDGQTEVSVQTGRNLFGGVNTEQAQVNLGYSFAGMNTPDLKGVSVTDNGGSISFGYLFARQEVKDMVNKLAVDVTMMESMLAFKTAESKWQDGFCVAVNVAGGKTQKVQAGSETPFTATVHHQFEGKDLAVPVIATLRTGGVSITPAEVKVPAAATFRYKAPDMSGMEASVELISRSRRGIGVLDVTFETQVLYYHADTLIGLENKVPVTGDICSLDKPFTLKVNGHNPSGGQYVGVIVFTPTSESGGNWKHTATSCIPNYGCGDESGGSTYQLAGVADGKPVLMMSATTASSVVKGYVGTWDWPAWQIELEPATGECSAE